MKYWIFHTNEKKQYDIQTWSNLKAFYTSQRCTDESSFGGNKSIRKQSDKKHTAVLVIIFSGFRRNLCKCIYKILWNRESNGFLISSVFSNDAFSCCQKQNAFLKILCFSASKTKLTHLGKRREGRSDVISIRARMTGWICWYMHPCHSGNKVAS